MKIIADTGKGYILEATEDELANLMGYSSDFHRRNYPEGAEQFRRASGRKLVPGDIIPIKKMYDHLYTMANKEKELMEISAKLKAAADFVDTALPTIKHVNKDRPEDPVEGVK